jgi:hypothetical protein
MRSHSASGMRQPSLAHLIESKFSDFRRFYLISYPLGQPLRMQSASLNTFAVRLHFICISQRIIFDTIDNLNLLLVYKII